MDDVVPVSHAAAALGTSPQTVRNYLRTGVLEGQRGPRNVWLVERKALETFLSAEGPLNGGRRSSRRTQELEVEQLRSTVAALAGASNADVVGEAIADRDRLRLRVAALEDTVARLRDVNELQRKAELERARMIEQLAAALQGSERVDGLRRQAIEALEDAVGGTVVTDPGESG